MSNIFDKIPFVKKAKEEIYFQLRRITNWFNLIKVFSYFNSSENFKNFVLDIVYFGKKRYKRNLHEISYFLYVFNFSVPLF